MKHISLVAISAFMLSVGGAFAAGPHIFANTFTMNNITAFQHSIMHSAMQTFEGTAAAALAGRSITGPAHTETEPSADLYGTLPMYGRPHLYGEYGDDGTVFQSGRNGGDILISTDTRPAVNSVWINWQHFNDDVKFKGYDELNSDYDLIMFGLAGGEAQWGIGISEWGIFGGYVGGTQNNHFIDIDENGGYIGLYSGYNIQNFNLSLAANAGALYNSAENTYGTDEFANMWAGVAVNATYNITLDDTFTLQPGVYAGYTWIGAADYLSKSGVSIANHNLNSFEIAPSLRAIKNIGRGWFGYIGVKHAFVSGHGGTVIVDGMKYNELDIRNYTEYGIGVEKSIDRFNVALNLNRRDGGRSGWTGSVTMKYIF